MALRRLIKELEDARKNPTPVHIHRIGPVVPLGSCEGDAAVDHFHWHAVLNGPKNGPYQHGKFLVDLRFPADYPFHGPRTRFITRLYSPNIDDQGRHCLDIDHTSWTPQQTAVELCRHLVSLLSDPNPDDPLDPEAASLYARDRAAFDAKTRLWTSRYARLLDRWRLWGRVIAKLQMSLRRVRGIRPGGAAALAALAEFEAAASEANLSQQSGMTAQLAPSEFYTALFHDPRFDRLLVLTNRRQEQTLRSFESCEWLSTANLLACSDELDLVVGDSESAEALASAMVHALDGVNAAYAAVSHDTSSCYGGGPRPRETRLEALLKKMTVIQSLMPEPPKFDLALGCTAPPDLAKALVQSGAADSRLWHGMCRNPGSDVIGEFAETVWGRDVAKQQAWARRLMEACAQALKTRGDIDVGLK